MRLPFILVKEIFVTCNVTRYICGMIKGFRHKGLKILYERGDGSKLQSRHILIT